MRPLGVRESLNVVDPGWQIASLPGEQRLMDLSEICGQLQIRLKDVSLLLAVVEKDCNFGSQKRRIIVTLE
jgi:hypothetical protein